jgi:hypothetical protein
MRASPRTRRQPSTAFATGSWAPTISTEFNRKRRPIVSSLAPASFFRVPEAPGLDDVLRGLSLVADDQELLELSGRLFDGLYELRRARAV